MSGKAFAELSGGAAELPGADIDYAPLGSTWFVASGMRDEVMFYERGTFTCGGRLINSCAMVCPAAERRVYDRFVEQVARLCTLI